MDKRCFDEWNEIKKLLQANGSMPFFREREIWWYAAGENLGSEINGKGPKFSRPMLIVRKYGEATFFGVPLSTKTLKGFWYSDIAVNGVTRCALLSQAGSFSTLRLYKKIDRLSETEFAQICSKLGWLLLKITPWPSLIEGDSSWTTVFWVAPITDWGKQW